MRLRIPEALRDARNVKLLRLLRDDPRASVAALARRIGMSAPAVRDRIRRLEADGVIRGYRIDLDPRALGYAICAYLRVRPMPGKLPKIAELAREMPQVVECHRITGEDCFIMKVHLEELDALDGILDRFLAYGQTTTTLVQSSPVPGRALPLPGDSRG